MNSAKRKIVIDTGTLVSATLRRGTVPNRAYLKAMAGYQVCVSDYTLDELERVLRREKFDRYLPLPLRLEFLRTYQTRTTRHEVTLQVIDCRDPKDNPFLALALTVQAEIILTSDPDLYSLNPYRGIQILKPAEFLEIS